MDYKGYIVYRYLNLNGEVIYVGKTDNLKRRFNEHKSEDMYKECYKVEYIELDNPADIEIYETYYINKYKPKYNSSKVYNCKPSFFIPEQEWKLYYLNRRNDTRHSTEIKRYEEIFKDINNLKFNGELPMPRILFTKTSPDGKFLFDEVIKTNDGFQYTIELNEEDCFKNTKQAVYSLFHNMIHMYCNIHNIKDTSNGETYHNKRFGAVATKFGGFIGKYKYGYRISGIDQEIKDEIYKHNINYDSKKKFKLNDKSKSCSTRKYQCPCCGNSFRATKEIGVMCMNCNQQFVVAKMYK